VAVAAFAEGDEVVERVRAAVGYLDDVVGGEAAAGGADGAGVAVALERLGA